MRVLLGAGVLLLSGTIAGAQAPAQSKPPAAAKNPLLRLVEPWPDAAQMQARKAAAEALKLFASEEPLAITLAGDFRNINRDRDQNSTKRFPAQMTIADSPAALPVQLSARGHLRRMARTCDYVPLRLEFQKASLNGTAFEGQDALKLVVQCRGAGAFEEFLLREYLVYRIFNVLTPNGLRARLAKVSYVDAAGKPAGTRYGMLLEDDSDVARRMEGRTVELPRVGFADLQADTLDLMMMFEYMIGNTDFSLYALHNVILVQTPDRKLRPVPYDFDVTGLVAPPYAIPDQRLPIKNVRDRLFRGPCRPPEQVAAVLAHFTSKKDAILALPDTIPDLSKSSRDDAKSFLDGFYRTISDQRAVRRVFTAEECSKASTM